MANLIINQGTKFYVGDGTDVIGTANPSGSQGISKSSNETGFYIQSSVNFTVWFYDGSSWSIHQTIDTSAANYKGGFAFAWDDNTAAYFKTTDSSHEIFVFGRDGDLRVDATPGDATQAADTIVDGSGTLSITAIDAQNDYTEGLTVASDGTVTFDRTDNNNAYQLKFSGNNITIGSNGSDTITLTGGDEFTSPLTTDGDLFIQSGGADSRLGIGSDGQYLSVSSGAPAWVDFGGSSFFEETTNSIKLDTGATTRDVLEINTGTANTYGASSFTSGSIIVGDGNTIGGAGNFRRSAVIGQGHTVGNTGGLQYSLVAGQTLTVNGSHNMVLGNYMTVDGNYNLVGVAGGAVYGNYNSKLGYVNTIGASANPVSRTTTLGYNLTADGSDQILIGRSFSTDLSYANFKGIFFGMDQRPSAGFFQDALIGSGMNFVVGGDQAMRSDLGVVQNGSGKSVFYMSNWSDNRVSEPTVDMPDAVAMWAKDRTANVKGLIVKAENGGKSWIGDRIGIGMVAPTASLEIKGEGSTSATSVFKINNSSNSTLFEVKGDGACYVNDFLSQGFGHTITSIGNTSFVMGGYNTFYGGAYSGIMGYNNKINASGNQTFLIGGSNQTDKTQVVLIGQGNKALYGNYAWAMGYGIQIGGTSYQTAIGHNLRLYSSSEYTKGVFMGANHTVNHPQFGIVIPENRDGTSGNIGIGIGSATKFVAGKDSSGAGVLYIANYANVLVEPTANATDAVGLWTKRWNGNGTMGLVIKSEEGTRHFLGAASVIGGDYNDAIDGVKLLIKGNTQIDGQVYAPYNTLTDGATITPDFNDSNNMVVTLAGNRTMANPSNLKDGASYTVIVKQDATGGRTLSFGTAFKWAGGTAPTLSTGANAVDILTFVSDGTNLYGSFVGDFQ